MKANITAVKDFMEDAVSASTTSSLNDIQFGNFHVKFASGASPAFPTASGSISLVSFTVHKAGAVGVNTVLLTGASVSFS